MDLVGSAIWRLVRPVSPALFSQLLWERGKRDGDPAIPLVEQLVQPGQVVVDIGANFGLFAYRLAKQVGPSGRVHVVEPQPIHHEALQKLADKRAGVALHRVALSDAPGTAELAIPRRDGETVDAMATLSGVAARGEHESVTVQVDTLDHVLASEPGPIAFVKCDVEGHEHEMLLGAREVLGRDLPALLIEIEQRHRDRPLEETFDLLTGLGYVGYAIRQGALLPLERFDVQRDQLAILAAMPGHGSVPPPPEYVNDFLFVAPSFQLPASVPVAA